MAKCNPDVLLLRALRGAEQERMPLWIMRQAGRYLPEYRALRKQAGSFLNLCRTPELACQATLQPLERYSLDAAIIFSDILIVPDAMGCQLNFAEGEGPFLERPAADAGAISKLAVAQPEYFSYVGQAISSVRQALPASVALIGFAGGPFTLACYMVQGHGGGQFAAARKMLMQSPQIFSSLIEKIVDAVCVNLTAQAQAGADVLMLFESWAALARPHELKQCIINPLAQIIAKLRAADIKQPIIVFPRNAEQVATELVEAGADAIGVSWQADLASVRDALAGRAAIQGNLDPAVLLADEQAIRQQTELTVAAHGSGPGGKIFNLGHGISKETDPAKVEILVDAVRQCSEG